VGHERTSKASSTGTSVLLAPRVHIPPTNTTSSCRRPPGWKDGVPAIRNPGPKPTPPKEEDDGGATQSSTRVKDPRNRSGRGILLRVRTLGREVALLDIQMDRTRLDGRGTCSASTTSRSIPGFRPANHGRSTPHTRGFPISPGEPPGGSRDQRHPPKQPLEPRQKPTPE